MRHHRSHRRRTTRCQCCSRVCSGWSTGGTTRPEWRLAADGGLWRNRAAEGTHSVRDLRTYGSDAPPTCAAGVGHTRWATHGQPSERNAHPHVDCTGRLALVHNGIIENHAELTAELEADGHVMASDTDSETLAHLVEAELRSGASLVDSLRAALRRVRGSFAVAAVHADEPQVLVAARRVSPLIVGLADDASYLASDIPALLGSTRQLHALEDDQLVELRPGSMVVTDLEGRPAQASELTIDWNAAAARQDGYDDFMTKEIHEQPGAVAATLSGPPALRHLVRPRRGGRTGRRRPQGHRADLHRRLWQQLPRRARRQVRHRGVGAGPGRGRHRQRVPVPESDPRPSHPCDRREPVRRNGRHPAGPSHRPRAGCQGGRRLQRGRFVDGP